MTTMTDKTAELIAEKTAKKFEDAGRKVAVITKNGDDVNVYNNFTQGELAEIGLNMFLKATGADAEDVLKDVAKQLKALKKQEKKDAKRKKRA